MLITKSLSENKAIEIQAEIQKDYYIDFLCFDLIIDVDIFSIKLNLFKLLGFRFMINRKQDHAGILFQLDTIFSFFHINFYDKRHWDDETNS